MAQSQSPTTDLTQMTEDELAAYRQAADEEMQAARDKKESVKQELLRREAEQSVDLMLPSMTEDQRTALAQHITDFTAGDQGTVGGVSGSNGTPS